MVTLEMAPAVLRHRDAARYLGISEVMLKRSRLQGWGPTPVMLGSRTVGYCRDDLDAWLRGRRRPVSGAAA